MKATTVLLTLLLSFSTLAQNSLFWQVEAPNGKTSFIFGTMHVVSKDKFYLPETVLETLKSCDKVFFEVNSAPDEKETVALSQMEEGRMSDYLDQAQKDSLYAYVEQIMGLDSVKYEYTLGKFKPFIFTQFPFMQIMLSGESIDMNLMRIARENDVPVEGFETYAEQMAYFDNLSDSMQAELIMSVVRETKNPQETWDELESHYLEQDLDAMMNDFEEEGAVEAFMSNQLLDERNKNWVRILTKRLVDEQLFIAVGAGHLSGENGLLQLLKNEGYSLTPLEISMYK